MTIPTRPAPLPPSSGRQNNGVPASLTGITTREAPPPRPPPPKIQSGSQKSISILSNLFGSKQGGKSTESRIPPKIPAPPSTSSQKSRAREHFEAKPVQNDLQLISFDNWPTASPSTMKKSGSDSVSLGSFCSSTSSPNFSSSNAESGFEDDFSVPEFKFQSSSSSNFPMDPFECLDASGPGKTTLPNIRNVKPQIQPKPIIESSSMKLNFSSTIQESAGSVESTPSIRRNFAPPTKASMPNMPTIIKPMVAGRSKPLLLETNIISSFRNTQTDDVTNEQLFSLPMPTVPPPQLPILEPETDEEGPSYAVVLYDFESDVIEDLNLKVNEKVYLIQQVNDEWVFGRNKRGCEGIFPLSFVEIRVPLKAELDSLSSSPGASSSVSPGNQAALIRVTHTFDSEYAEDLTIKEHEMVSVLYEINPEWLFGSNEKGDFGQFPANFIEYIPQNLPQMPTS